MRELTTEQFNQDWLTFWNNMQTAKIAPLYKEEELMQLMKNASAATNEDSGASYPGALLVHINLVTALAQRLAKLVSGTFTINEESLLKVCLLHQFAKAIMFVKNDNEWRVNNLGENYKFAQLVGRLKCGERSIFYAVKKGVQFSAIEWEAMSCLDKDANDKGAYFDNILTTIIRQANELAQAIEKEKNKK